MKTTPRIMEAARELALSHAYDKITFADIAKKAQVHWTTVRRAFGSKEKMRQQLLEFQSEIKGPVSSDTKTKILESAERVFAKYGYDGATLDQVSLDAGMTKGAVYWHFTSKSDLFLALTEKRLKELLAELTVETSTILKSSSPQETLREVLKAQFASCEQENNDKPLLLFEFISKRREPEIREKLDTTFSALLAGTSQVLKNYQEKGLVSNQVDSESLSVTFHALMNGIVLMWLLSPKSVPLSALADDVSKVIWEGFRPKN